MKRRIILGKFSLVMTLAVLCSGLASLAAAQGRIAFESTRSFSPDGSKIAFSTYRDGNWEVYVMNADGSNPTRLTELPGLDAAPSWNGSAPPAAANQCQNGGWALFTDPTFKDQGECIKFVNNGGF